VFTLGLFPLVENLVVLDLEPVGDGAYRAKWAEQGRGFALKVATGWLVNGYLSRAATLDRAHREEELARHDGR
jgi:hypothetical protein